MPRTNNNGDSNGNNTRVTDTTVRTLTAEVRVLMVGSRQVTLSVYAQLDTIDADQITPIGRVRARDGLGVIGADSDGRLVRAGYPVINREIGPVCDSAAWLGGKKAKKSRLDGQFWVQEVIYDHVTLRVQIYGAAHNDDKTCTGHKRKSGLSQDDWFEECKSLRHMGDDLSRHLEMTHRPDNVRDAKVEEIKRLEKLYKDFEDLELIVLAGLR
jgi:hypothetical protein